MRPMRMLPRLITFSAALALVLPPITGCGGPSVTQGEMSPAMKSADAAGIKAMEEFAKSKKQQKKKGAGKASGGAAPIPGAPSNP